ncbi:hypothetical protein ACJQWY_01420 [Weissella kandleri]|uniref:hypothetical protein n=1 Tax=Weissella kandleri TaxID=1616 RepID=UPI00387EBF8E
MKDVIKYKSVTILSTIFSVSIFGPVVGEANSNGSPVEKENILFQPLKKDKDNKIILTKKADLLQQSIKEQEEIIANEETKLNILIEENQAFNIVQKEQLDNLKEELDNTFLRLLGENEQRIINVNEYFKQLMARPGISEQEKTLAKSELLSKIDEVNKIKNFTVIQVVNKFERKEQEIIAIIKQTNEDYQDKRWQHEKNIRYAEDVKAKLVAEINAVLKDETVKTEPVKVEEPESSIDMVMPDQPSDENIKEVNESTEQTENTTNDEVKISHNLKQRDKSTSKSSNNETLNTVEKGLNHGKSSITTIQNLGSQENNDDSFNALLNNFSDIWNILGEASQALNDNNNKLVKNLSNTLSQGIDELSVIVDEALAPQVNFNVKNQDTLNNEKLHNNSLTEATNRGGDTKQSLNHKVTSVNIVHDKMERIVKEDKKQKSTEISNQPELVKSLISKPTNVVEQSTPIVNEMPKELIKPIVVKDDSGIKIKANDSSPINGKIDLLVKGIEVKEANEVNKVEVKAPVNVLQEIKSLIQEVQNNGKQVKSLATMPTTLPETAVKEKSDRILTLLVCIGASCILMSGKLINLKNKQTC